MSDELRQQHATVEEVAVLQKTVTEADERVRLAKHKEALLTNCCRKFSSMPDSCKFASTSRRTISNDASPSWGAFQNDLALENACLGERQRKLERNEQRLNARQAELDDREEAWQTASRAISNRSASSSNPIWINAKSRCSTSVKISKRATSMSRGAKTTCTRSSNRSNNSAPSERPRFSGARSSRTRATPSFNRDSWVWLQWEARLIERERAVESLETDKAQLHDQQQKLAAKRKRLDSDSEKLREYEKTFEAARLQSESEIAARHRDLETQQLRHRRSYCARRKSKRKSPIAATNRSENANEH